MFILLLLISHVSPCQDSIPAVVARPVNTRFYIATAGTLAGYGLTVAALSNAWYKQYPQSSFHFYNDLHEWMQMDKAGHIFSSYTISRLSNEAWRWAGLEDNTRILAAALTGSLYMTTIEALDGFSADWGFSLGDISANLAGSLLFASQEMIWKEQRIHMKFSFHRSHYNDASLNHRSDALFGSTATERILKDYNAQTYWLSVNLSSFNKHSRIPRWLNIAVGYGATGMFGGTENIQRDYNGNIVFNRNDIARYRIGYLAPDIDLTRIKTKNKLLKTVFFLLNSVKFPTPAIAFSKKGIEWKWMAY